jgi:hypothetical protein
MVPAWVSTSRPGREPGRGRAVPAVILAAALAAAAAACGSSASSGTSAVVGTARSSTASAAPSATVSAAGARTLTGAAATALLAKAVADTKAAPSVVVKSPGLSSGTAGQPLSLDLTMVRNVGCKGSVAESKTQSFQLVVRDGYTWMLPSASFYASLKLSQGELALIADKWIKAKSTDSQVASLADICSFSTLFSSMKTTAGAAYVATPTTYAGQSAYEVTQSGQQGYAYVTNSATPTLAEVDVPGANGGVMTFTVYGTPLAITTPSAAESVGGDALGF